MFKMFNKTTLLILILLAMPVFSEQPGFNRKFPLTFRLYGGFSVGMNKLDVAGTALENNTGKSFGLGADYGLMPQLAVGVDFLCIEKGYLLVSNGVSSRYR